MKHHKQIFKKKSVSELHLHFSKSDCTFKKYFSAVYRRNDRNDSQIYQNFTEKPEITNYSFDRERSQIT